MQINNIAMKNQSRLGFKKLDIIPSSYKPYYDSCADDQSQVHLVGNRYTVEGLTNALNAGVLMGESKVYPNPIHNYEKNNTLSFTIDNDNAEGIRNFEAACRAFDGVTVTRVRPTAAEEKESKRIRKEEI